MSDREWLKDLANDVANHGEGVVHEVDMRRAVAMLPEVLGREAELLDRIKWLRMAMAAAGGQRMWGALNADDVANSEEVTP